MSDAVLHARPSAWLHSKPSLPSASRDVMNRASVIDQTAAGSVAKLQPSTTGASAANKRAAYLHVPPTYRPDTPSPLLVMLHGAGGNGLNTLATFGALDVLDKDACLLLVPESRGSTWDIIRGDFGPDVSFIDATLDHVFTTHNVDAARCGLAGFSDGASYGLSLGLCNGGLFSHIIAFSPGFMRPPLVVDSPAVYISHGIRDAVLNIDFCSRRIVPRLSKMLPPSAQLNYVEFEGGHSVTPRIASQALSWFLEGAAIHDATLSQGPASQST